MASPVRRGAALILSLVILAALLLLGLPFLFSQSSALTGTRSYAHHQATGVARDSAEALAIAAAAYAVEPYWAPGSPDHHSDLFAQLVATAPDDYTDPDPIIENRLAMRFGGTAIVVNAGTTNRATIGASIEDESGKLDVNALSPRAWHELLQALQIQDWDDNAVSDSDDPVPDGAGDTDGNGNDDDDGIAGIDNGDNEDDDDGDGITAGDANDEIGELAEALAIVRQDKVKVPWGVITQLEQLLLADPGHNAQAVPGGTYNPAGSYGYRRRLTRAELERLRPYLTVHNLGQARGGVIDLGTVAFMDAAAAPAQPILDSEAWKVLSRGTTLISEQEWFPGAHKTAISEGGGLGTYGNVLAGDPRVAANDALGIVASAEVNLHAASRPVREVLRDVDMPTATVPGFGVFADTPDTIKHLGEYGIVAAGGLKAWVLQDPISSGYELPPLGIASLGLISIESAAVFNDASGRQGAQRTRRVVAQALPQESLLERKWTHQGAIEHALMARHSSRLVSWPEPIARISDSSVDETGIVGASADTTTGMRPEPLPSIDDDNVAPHFTTDWTRTFMGVASMAMQTGQKSTVPVAAFDADDITPEGVIVTGKTLSYQFDNTTSFLTPDIPAPAPPETFPIAVETGPRQVSLWVRSTQPWTGQCPIIEIRGPEANAGQRLTGAVDEGSSRDVREDGDTLVQNRWSLWYDGTLRHLVLSLENAEIEHPANDYGPAIPFDDPDTGDLDEGSQAHVSAGTVPPLAPKRPLDRVEHRYLIDLQPDRWYLIQVVVASDRLDGQAIIVDGLVGRDVLASAIAGGSPDLDDQGDHITLPCMLLTNGISAATTQAAALAYSTIALKALPESMFPANNLADILPRRGCVRINDEYFSYEDIAGSTLVRCRRARRQDTSLITAGATIPVMPLHAPRSVVVPGGFRAHRRDGRLYRGGCRLGNDVITPTLPSGTASPLNAGRMYVWAQLQGTGTLAPTADIVLTGPMATQFPPDGGFVAIEVPETVGGVTLVRTYHAYYDAALSGTLTGVQGWWDFTAHLATPSTLTYDTSRPPPFVYLVSMSAIDNNPRIDDRYNPLGGLIQLYEHRISETGFGYGRVEWLNYTDLEFNGATSKGFIIDRLGFYHRDPADTRRGRQRTHFNVSIPWKSGARLLPVQSSYAGTILEPGDVVTIAPHAPAGLAHQAVVRFAAKDDFKDQNDTDNTFFAFTEALPDSADMPTLVLMATDLISWPCWNGADLSIFQNKGDPMCGVHGLMPRINAFATGFGSGADDRRVSIAAFDDRVPPPTTASAFEGVVDKVTAGAQRSGGQPEAANDVVVAAGAIVAATAITPASPVAVELSVALDPEYGLVRLGGEVFAYHAADPADRRKANLIGRGLLGSTRQSIGVGAPVLHLPLGPVAVLMTPNLGVAEAKKVEFTSDSDVWSDDELLKAPAVLLTKADGTGGWNSSDHEVAAFPRPSAGSIWGATAPWLRGLYGTTAKAWAKDDTIAIGWYPRYPSALPTVPLEEHHRCRTYPWASFAMRLYDARADLSSATVELIDDGDIAGVALFAIEARATGRAFANWGGSGTVTLNGPGSFDLTSIITALGQNTDGVETRIAWRYLASAGTSALPGIARNGNRAPMIGPMRMQMRAASAIIATEDVR